MIRVARHPDWHWAHRLALWTGFAIPDLKLPGIRVSPLRMHLFRGLNWPWSTLAVVTVVVVWGGHFPPISPMYVLAGLAGSATVARVAPELSREMTSSTPDLQRSYAQASHASRRALGWSLAAMLAVPWFGEIHVKIAWLALVIPVSFAGRALWEPWWWRTAWLVSGALARAMHR